MTGRVTVNTCAPRRDGQWMITYRLPGGVTAVAVSAVQIAEGKSVAILDGKVVRGAE
jgi:hypothetical protein